MMFICAIFQRESKVVLRPKNEIRNGWTTTEHNTGSSRIAKTQIHKGTVVCNIEGLDLCDELGRFFEYAFAPVPHIMERTDPDDRGWLNINFCHLS